MKLKNLLLNISVCGFIGLGTIAQDHGHLNAGAVSHEPGSQLIFENGADFSTNSLYIKTLNFASSGKFAGFYEGNITLTALHSTDAFGSPIPNSPAPGSFVIGEITSVQAPEGGVFGFWETNSTAASGPAFSLTSGTPNPVVQFDLSDSLLGAGMPGADPFGHIHGRRFTATKPGLYVIGFRLLETSVNGPANGPIHLPSQPLHVFFQAGVNILGVSAAADATAVTFGAAAGFLWQLQSIDELASGEWTDIEVPILGEDKITQILDQRPPASSRFYRLTGEPFVP